MSSISVSGLTLLPGVQVVTVVEAKTEPLPVGHRVTELAPLLVTKEPQPF